jgi:hypothetical protein
MATVIKVKRNETASTPPGTGDLVVGEIAINTADQKLFIKDSTNTIKEIGGGVGVTLHNVTTANNSTSNDIHLDGSNIVFEGSTADAAELTLTVEDPDVDRTLTLPNSTGILATDGDVLAFSVVFGG